MRIIEIDAGKYESESLKINGRDIEEIISEKEKNARRDVIDEFFNMLESVSFGNRKGLVHWKNIVSIREQLKE